MSANKAASARNDPMRSYSFRYLSASGATVRMTAMQCASDAEARARARDTMQDSYAALEISDGERLVHRQPSTTR